MVMDAKKDRMRLAEKAVNDINKKYENKDGGLLTMRRASEIVPPEKLPFNIPSLDLALGGGVDFSRFCTIFGGMGTAKSTLCYKLIASAQRMGKIAVYVDAEARFSAEWADANGVIVEDLLFPDLTGATSAEQILDLYIRLATAKAADIIVIDSISAISPQEELDKSLGEHTMALTARVLSQFFRKSISITRSAGICGVLIGQFRNTMSMYPSRLDGLAGGNALKHTSHYIINTSRKNPPSGSSITKDSGFILTTNILKGPGIEGLSLDFEFAHDGGLDTTIDVIKLATNAGLVTRAGSIYTLFGEKHKGFPALAKAVKENKLGDKIIDDLKSNNMYNKRSLYPIVPEPNPKDSVVNTDLLIEPNNIIDMDTDDLVPTEDSEVDVQADT